MNEQTAFIEVAGLTWAVRSAIAIAFWAAVATLASRRGRRTMRTLASIWGIYTFVTLLGALAWFATSLRTPLVAMTTPIISASLGLFLPALLRLADEDVETGARDAFWHRVAVIGCVVGFAVGLAAGATFFVWPGRAELVASTATRTLLIGIFVVAAIWYGRAVRRTASLRARLLPMIVGTCAHAGLSVLLGALRTAGVVADIGLSGRAATLVSGVLATLGFGVATLLTALEEEHASTTAHEEAIRAASVRALQSQRLESLGRLASAIAHDFNNLLTVILGSAEVAGTWLATKPEAVAAELRSIESAGERGSRLVRQLLSFARRQPGGLQTFAPTDVAADLVPMLERLVGRMITIRATFAGTARVTMDSTQFEQIVVNLVTNAREAMPHGGTVEIDVRDDDLIAALAVHAGTLPPGPYVRLRVSDTGVGITDDMKPRLFEPFFTTRADAGGTGLGLATVLSATRLVRGGVKVTSVPGAGAQFDVWIPASA